MLLYQQARLWVSTNMEELTGLFKCHPYIDMDKCIRQHQDLSGEKGKKEAAAGDGGQADGGKVEPYKEFPDMDIILHVPPSVDTAYLQLSMVLAIVIMMWRRPQCLRSWSVIGTFDSTDTWGRVIGTHGLDSGYVSKLQRVGYTHLLVAPTDVESIKKSCGKTGVDMEEGGFRVIGCETVMDVVRAALV